MSNASTTKELTHPPVSCEYIVLLIEGELGALTPGETSVLRRWNKPGTENQATKPSSELSQVWGSIAVVGLARDVC
jgi:hypothetical protein